MAPENMMKVDRHLEIKGSLLARNTALNFVGQVIPLFVGVITIPYIIRGLGTESFGILSLAWVFLGYCSLFDLGLGRATTRFAADCLGRGQMDHLPKLVWTSLGLQVIFGIGGGLLVGACVPLLVDKVLNISPALVRETRSTLFILAASLPIVLATTALRGVLEAGQRFDLVNYVKVPANISTFVLPAIALILGFRLPGIIFLLATSWLAATVAYLVLCLKVFPSLRQRFSLDFSTLRPLVAYGGWVTVSNVIGPLLIYLDRFIIGSRLSLTAVGYYTAPYEAITRLWVFPGSLVATLFPSFSSLGASGASERLGQIYTRSVKFLLLALGPLFLLIVVFAHEILRLWLGGDFAEKSTLVLQILALGVFVNSLAWVPYSLLQGLGRPDLTAKFHLLELPFYAGLVWFLVGNMGIAGAALAWTLRVGADAVLLFGASWWLRLVPLHTLVESGLLRGILAFSALAGILSLALLTSGSGLIHVFFATLLVSLFAVASWRYALDCGERTLLASAVGQMVLAFRGAR